MTNPGGTTRYTCLLPDCGWTHDVPSPGEDETAGIAPDPAAATLGEALSSIAYQAALRRADRIEDVLADHMGGHTAAEWARALTDAQTARRQLEEQMRLGQHGAAAREAVVEECRDVLEAAGERGPHGDDWPRLAPAVRAVVAERDTAHARLEAIREAVVVWRDRPGGDVGLAIALAGILDAEQPEPPAAAALVRALAECDRLNREVRGLSPVALAGRRDAVARIRAAAAGAEEGITAAVRQPGAAIEWQRAAVVHFMAGTTVRLLPWTLDTHYDTGRLELSGRIDDTDGIPPMGTGVEVHRLDLPGRGELHDVLAHVGISHGEPRDGTRLTLSTTVSAPPSTGDQRGGDR